MDNDTSTVAKPYAFLFDGGASGLPNSPLPFFTASVLSALSRADPESLTCSQVRLGIPMLTSFAERTSAVRGSTKGSSRTVAHDVDVYKYVVWEWLNSLDQGWNSINRKQAEESFRLHTSECVSLSALCDGIRDSVDTALKNIPGYVGCFEIDPGNPVHRKAFFDLLLYAAAIMNGAVVQERSFEGDEDWPLEGASQFRPGGLVWQDNGWLAQGGPQKLSRTGLSELGAKAATNVAKKQGLSIEGRVIEAIGRAFLLNADRKNFEFQSLDNSTDMLQAIMPEGKFTKYLFNREHKEGRSKAAFFIDTIGIQPEDWRYLAAQFYYGLLKAQPGTIRLNEWEAGYGVRFDVRMRIRGRSGNKAIVITGWNMNPGKLPSLSTAFPGDRDENANVVEPADPPILPPGAKTDTEWEQLWNWANAAGIQESKTVIPTPMYIVGFEPVPEGTCGNAIVRVPDARKGLARWLVRHQLGKTDGYGGAIVISPLTSQSLDRATAWARAVISILHLNGISAKLETYLS